MYDMMVKKEEHSPPRGRRLLTAMEMHSSFDNQRVSTESGELNSSLWTLPSSRSSRENCAF